MTKMADNYKSVQAFARVKQAIEDIKQGKMVVMVDYRDCC